jgi:fatty acid desaturase
MLLASTLLLVQWRAEQFSFAMYALTLVLAFAVGIMNHNHCHAPLWHSRRLNRLTDCWFTLFLGHPGFVFGLCHERNHHRHRNRAQDWTRTWRARDDNCLSGFLRHPFESAITLQPHIAERLRQAHAQACGVTRDSGSPAVQVSEAEFGPWDWHWIRLQYLLLVCAIGLALFFDPLKAIVFVVVPQLTALFFLLGANYLQHAHTDESSTDGHSRTFLGWVNPLFFNIGYHAAHHLRGSVHWSELPGLHARIAHTLDPRVVERSLAWYCLRVFVLSIVVPHWRSQSLRRLECHHRVPDGRRHTRMLVPQ